VCFLIVFFLSLEPEQKSMKKFLALSLVCLSALLASCNPPAENGDSSSAEETTSSAESSPSAEDQSKYQVEAAQITAIFEPSRTRNLTVEHTEKLKESDKENRSKGVSKIVGDEAQVAIETEAGASGAEGTVVDGRIVERPEGMLKAYMSYVKASPDFANPPHSEVQAWEEKTYPDVASFFGRLRSRRRVDGNFHGEPLLLRFGGRSRFQKGFRLRCLFARL
jgi:hypothetical protein